MLELGAESARLHADVADAVMAVRPAPALVAAVGEFGPAFARHAATLGPRLLAPLAKQHIIFNLFNYITFRAAGATVTALLFAFVIGPWIINRLRTLRV